jgi:arylsulfatase A-like enzyme
VPDAVPIVIRRLLAFAGAVVICAGCGACEPRVAPGENELQGVVLILLDTVRADRVSSYGHSRPTTPNIDALAGRGVRFSQVVAPAPWTLPSVAGLLSGAYPTGGFMPKRKLDRSLVEDFASAGLVTAAVTEGGYFSRAFELDRGFQTFVEEEGPVQFVRREEEREPDSRGGIENTFRKARQWLEENGHEPFFLLVHTYEAHAPYRRKTFTDGMDPGRVGGEVTIEFVADLKDGRMALTDAEVEYIKALYDGGVHHADRHVGEFVTFLEEIGIADRTLVVVTSDHGEELDDHYRDRTADHGHSLRDPLLMVPLVIYDPTRTYSQTEVTAQVRLIDVVPTIAELLGVEIATPIDGRSLLSLMTGKETAGRQAFASHTSKGPLRAAIRDRGFKYISIVGRPGSKKFPKMTPTPPQQQLYDLNADPEEWDNLTEENPEITEAFESALKTIRARLKADERIEAPEITDPELLERLRSLGYVE